MNIIMYIIMTKDNLSQANIGEIKKRRKEIITRIKISLDKLETLEKQEEIYRERKKILNLKQNQRRKEEKKNN